MEIKTKYDIGDTIHFMYKNHPCSDSIVSIDLFQGGAFDSKKNKYSADDFKPEIKYNLAYGCKVPEEDAFTSREELKNSLFNG